MTLHAQEHLDVHYHARLRVTVDGTPVPVPGELGISGSADEGSSRHNSVQYAALHTHSADGILHVESQRDEIFTLHQVFILWNVLLAEGRIGSYHSGDEQQHQVTVFVDGRKTRGDPREIVLKPDQDIAIVVKPGRPASAANQPDDLAGRL